MKVQFKKLFFFLHEYTRFQLKGNGKAWRIYTHLTYQERLMLYNLARRQPSGSIMCEIGSYLGASTCFLAAGAVEIAERKATVHCIDTWENEGMSEGLRDTWTEFQTNTNRYRHVIVPHRGKSSDISNNFNNQIDLLFIDGDHSYEGVKTDWDAYKGFLKTGSIIVFHDWGWAEGVKRVILEEVSPLVSGFDNLPNMWWGAIK